jgi:Protein of unknown function (DUF1115)
MVGEEQENYDCELEERRKAEIDFISYAYGCDEAWCENVTSTTTTNATNGVLLSTAGMPEIHRRLKFSADGSLTLRLSLRMPPGYPESQHLELSCIVEETNNVSGARSAYKAVPKLLDACREELVMGEESVLRVLSRADEWIDDNRSDYLEGIPNERSSIQRCNISSTGTSICFGRRLIYSHHIIAKSKRGDIHTLAGHYKLTGYMKVGWPGLILIEGAEHDCLAFYDAIRRWSWKFLVVRGEQQFEVREVESNRKFDKFVETDDMSQLAQHCREVGLEALFRTAMKVYTNTDDDDDDDNDANDVTYYGALVYVDHMNDTKGYRKWLRKTAKEVDCFLLMKQTYPNHDFSKKPIIVVAIVGDADLVGQFLKRWRTSRVDVDSKGKPCFERMTTVLIEGVIADHAGLASIDWDNVQAEENVNITSEQLHELVLSIGGDTWNEALSDIIL